MLTSSLATARSRWRGVSKFAPWDGISVPGAAIGRLNRRRGKQASADRRWPLANPDEGTLTRTRGGAQAQTGAGACHSCSSSIKQRQPARSGAFGPCPLAADSGESGRAAALSLHADPQDRSCLLPSRRSLRLKIDPGAKTTGLALVHDTTGQVVWAAELAHRGEAGQGTPRCSAAPVGARGASATPATARRASPTAGGGRAGCPPRWRVVSPICSPGWSGCDVGVPSALSAWNSSSSILSSCRTPSSVGWSINRATLAGYEVKEYLLEKWGRRCAYCGATDRPLQVEHIVPRVRHGSNRVSNLTLACEDCNDTKGKRTAEEFGYPQIQAQAKQPLRDAAAVNATRWALYHRLSCAGIAPRDGDRGTNQVEPHAAGPAQDALARRHLCGGQHACYTATCTGSCRWPFGRPDGIVGRCAGRTLPGFLTKRPKRPVWLTGSGPGTSCARRYRLRVPRQECMWDGSRSGPLARATSRRRRGPCRASTCGIVRPSIVEMAMPTRKEWRYLPRRERWGLRANVDDRDTTPAGC